MTIKLHREVPDLIQLLVDMNKRVSTLESARRLGNASIDNGELTVRNGDIVVRNDVDEEVTRITHGSAPRIKFTPVYGPAEHTTEIFSWESASQGAAMELGIRDGTGLRDGGKLLLLRGASYLSHQPQGAEETYVALSENDSYPNHISFRGKFLPTRLSGKEPWEMGYDSFGAGFGASSYGFAHEYEQVPYIFYTISGATANFYHCLVSPSTTGFTVGWSGSDAHSISWLAIRR